MQPDASCSGQKRKSSEATAPGKVGLDAKQKVCEFKVSIKQIDYYTTKPTPGIDICYSPFSGQEVPLAPVVRVFGSTPAGQTVCLHLHKILPYLYIKWDDTSTLVGSDGEAAVAANQCAFLRKLANAIDFSFQLSQQAGKPNYTGGGDKPAALKPRCVHSCTLVRALPFYGYHKSEELFVKIYIYEPKNVSKVANLLLSGVVMGQTFQPYEAHVPYLLKFKSDYNLHGMEYIRLSRVLVREPPTKPAPQWSSIVDPGSRSNQRSWNQEGGEYPVWSQDNIPQSWLSLEGTNGLGQEAYCDIEVDAFGEYILNPSSMISTDLQKARKDMQMLPSLAPIWAEEKKRNQKLNLPFPPRVSLSPRRRSEHFVGGKYKGMYQDAVKNLIGEIAGAEKVETDQAASALHSQNSDIDLSIKLTQAANVVKSLEEDNHESEAFCDQGNQRPRRQSQLETQEIDKLLLDTLHWMQQSKGDLSESAGNEQGMWEGEREQPEEKIDMEEYLTMSQKECEDIIYSTMHSVEADDVSSSSDSDSSKSQEDYKECSPPCDANGGPLYDPLTPESDIVHPTQPRSDIGTSGGLGSQPMEKETEGRKALLLFKPITSPPSYSDVKMSMQPLGLSDIVYTQPFFSKALDVPNRPTSFAGMEFKLKSRSAMDLPGFSSDAKSGSKFLEGIKNRMKPQESGPKLHLLVSSKLPPSVDEIRSWLSAQKANSLRKLSIPARDFRMDPNSGKFIACSARDGTSQSTTIPSASFVETPSNYLEEARPASPKYDEQVPLHTIDASYKGFPDSNQDVKEESSQQQTQGKGERHGPSKLRIEISGNDNGISQITPPSLTKNAKDSTPSSQAGYKYRRLEGTHSTNACPTVLSIEIFVETRGTFLPDPKYDAVKAIALLFEAQNSETTPSHEKLLTLNLLVQESTIPKDFISAVKRKYHLSERSKCFVLENEVGLISKCAEQILEADPDIIVGYELQSESVGYLNDRLQTILPKERSFLRRISRSPTIPSNSETLSDEYGQLHASGLHSAGRILLNLWRVLRSELKLNIYTFQNCVYALLRTKVPYFSPAQLTGWFNIESSRRRCLDSIVQRAVLDLEMIECIDLISRTCELARVYGIDFFSVITRGSQYRVESLLLRLAHTQNYILLSPSKSQVANQSAMECLPLVMEPESRFYTSPVLVLDFQSLYPSMVMAYNLCYSTLVGHTDASGVAQSLGVISKSKSRSFIGGEIPLEDLVFSPNGSLFTSEKVRKGVLPRMLQEILDTRQMLKRAMKKLPSKEKALYRLLNSRQFALKLLANVTYGYAAAGFSGRMPCAELADAIVQFGRVTMESTIKMVEQNPKWDAKVVYGDTDSIFVHLPGRSREEAFQIGNEIAMEVTSVNPSPVFLKFEKVYHPCILVTKKRYVGYAYERVEQSKPFFDAKGIETIRRDSCPAVSKLLERSLRILFDSKDLSLVKGYLLKQWEKIFKNRINIQDFIFAKEVRLGTYSAKAAAVPPAAIVAAKAMALDPRAEPKYAERVPYVVVYGEPGARLVDMVIAPSELVLGSKRLHENYYITKQIIPALDRIFGLLGVSVKHWFVQMPKPNRWQPTKRPLSALGLGKGSSRSTIDHFYLSRHCAVCDEMTATDQSICVKCCQSPQATALALLTIRSTLERRVLAINSLCSHCGGSDEKGNIVCSSLDCGVYFLRQKTAQQLHASTMLLLSSSELL